MEPASFGIHVMAVDRVEKRLRRVTATLDAARIRYAVVGGNAVAAWVARIDPSATRATRDVGLLVQRSDLEAITRVMNELGFERQVLRSLVLFIDPDEPSRRSGVHLVWADQLVRPSYPCPAPSVTEAVQDPEGFWVLDLPALVRMKLTSNRDIDRVHVRDMLSVGLVPEPVEQALPTVLRERLAEIRGSLEDEQP